MGAAQLPLELLLSQLLPLIQTPQVLLRQRGPQLMEDLLLQEEEKEGEEEASLSV